jgi:hypothetical protein
LKWFISRDKIVSVVQYCPFLDSTETVWISFGGRQFLFCKQLPLYFNSTVMTAAKRHLFLSKMAFFQPQCPLQSFWTTMMHRFVFDVASSKRMAACILNTPSILVAAIYLYTSTTWNLQLSHKSTHHTRNIDLGYHFHAHGV